jgi:hypothetical protein
MRRMAFMLILIPTLMGFTGPLSAPKTVCYICKLRWEPIQSFPGFSAYTPAQTLTFEVMNLTRDPLVPLTISIPIEEHKYARGFFKKDKTYTVVAEYSREAQPVGLIADTERLFSCFRPFVVYLEKYRAVNISTTE